jgi:hypothetical protein
MINWIKKRIRRWRCRRHFNRLPRESQLILKLWRLDPESLKKRGEI